MRECTIGLQSMTVSGRIVSESFQEVNMTMCDQLQLGPFEVLIKLVYIWSVNTLTEFFYMKSSLKLKDQKPIVL